MAKIKNNLITQGLSGMLGSQLVFRQTSRGTVVSAAPQGPSGPATTAQLAQRERFQQAVVYAKGQAQDPAVQAAYADAARAEDLSVYNLLLRDFMQAPTLGAIGLDQYAGQVGNLLTVVATDDYAVRTVTVKIERADGTLVEQGPATQQPDPTRWHYLATQPNPALAGSRVTVVATTPATPTPKPAPSKSATAGAPPHRPARTKAERTHLERAAYPGAGRPPQAALAKYQTATRLDLRKRPRADSARGRFGVRRGRAARLPHWQLALEVQLQEGIYLLPGKGLADEARDGQLVDAGEVAGIHRGGEQDDDGGRLLGGGQGLEGFEKPDAIHARHVDVEQQQGRLVGRELREQGQGLLAAVGHVHVVGHVEASEQVLVEEVGGVVVIDEQDSRQLLHG